MSRRTAYQIELLTTLHDMAKAHPAYLGPAAVSQIEDWYRQVVEQESLLDPADMQQVEQVYEQFSHLLI